MEECLTSSRKTKNVASFYFYCDIGDYTGISASSYEDFLTSLKLVNTESLSFHIGRGDFQKWVLDVLKDKKLAREIGRVNNQRLQGQALRNRLYRIVSKRHRELASKAHTRS